MPIDHYEQVAWMREWEGDCSDYGAMIFADIDEPLDEPLDRWVPLYVKLALDQNQLVAALKLAKEMMIANGLNLPHTFEIIDDALAGRPVLEGDR